MSKGTQSRGTRQRDHDLELMTHWMKLLTEQGQTVALWVKHRRRPKHDDAHVGGYYTTDRIGAFVSQAVRFSGCSTGVHWSINPIAPDSIDDVNGGVKVGGGAVRNAMIERRRWLPIDLDPVRRNGDPQSSATDREKSAAEELAYCVVDELAELDWPSPVMIDTGNGYCLLYRVDLPTDDRGLIRRVLKRLDQELSNERAKVDTSVGDASRVLKIPGTWGCKGEPTTDRPHRRSRVLRMFGCGHGVVSEERLRDFAERRDDPGPHEDRHSASVPESVIEAARKYIAEMPPAVQGENGHDTALNVAQRIVVGFDIPADSHEAHDLLLEWNDRCDPPWNSDERADLLRKLTEADRLANENGEARGQLRRWNTHFARPHEPLCGETFAGEIPDYVPFPTKYARLPVESWQSSSSAGLLRHLMVWAQQRSDAVVPDVLARQVVWGANYPQGWLRDLRTMFFPKSKPHPTSECPEHCPLHGTKERHRHFAISLTNKKGAVRKHHLLDDHFVGPFEEGLPERRKFHFHDPGQPWSKRRRECHKEDLVRYCYALPLYFGFGRRIGFTRRQVRLWLGITGELTRRDRVNGDESTAFRPDKAEVLAGGLVVSSGRGRARVSCPILDSDSRYVTFAGNNRGHAGRGYPIVNGERLCWLDWSGYTIEQQEEGRWGCVRNLLADLTSLADPLDLVVAARHHDRDQWKSLDELPTLLKSGYGREWLEECRLRIFAPEDFLVRWRYLIAKRLGFDWIPGGAERPFLRQEQSDKLLIANGDSLVRFMEERQLTQKEFADQLGRSRATVSRHIQGHSNSSSFWEAASDFAAQM